MVTTPFRTSAIDRVPRLWALWAASRPSQLALILVVTLLGVGMGTTGAPIVSGGGAAGIPGSPIGREHLSRFVLGGVLVVSVSIPVHYANEYADVDTDRLTERTAFSGGSGALPETGLPPEFLGRATLLTTLLAVSAVGVGVVSGTLPIDAAGLLIAILVIGLAYSLPPVSLVRRGVGEAVNALLGGIMLPLYGVTLVGTPTPAAVLAVVPFTLVVACTLLATHWPDREADAAVGKRTLAVRLDPPHLRRAYTVLASVAGILVLFAWSIGVLPALVAIAHLAPIPFLLWGRLVLARQADPLPSVAAMVVLAIGSAGAWWVVGMGWS